MNTRFRLIHRGERGNKFYCVDSETGKRFSLKTKDRDAAEQIVLTRGKIKRKNAPVISPARWIETDMWP